MSNLVRDYVDKLSRAEKIQIIRDYEKYDTQGTIRLHALALLALIGIRESHVAMWMELLVKECFRHFALILIGDEK